MAGRDVYLGFAARRPDLFQNVEDGVRIELAPQRIAEIEAEVAERYRAAGHPAEWAEVALLYLDPWIAVLRDAVAFPDGSVALHHRVVRTGDDPSGVVVCPRLGDRLALVRIFRHATRRWHWELPRGAVDGEGHEAVLERELWEEIGARALRVERLGVAHGATNLLNSSAALYFAEVDAVGAPQRSEGIVATRLVSVAELEDMIRAGAITDGYTLAAFAHARLRGLL